uniref:Anaphase-promoting complex subunit 4-like WD40 domain-containing protein n=1 Tax=Leersia perrieri TaxID=77586 RepID=A0A0D9XNR4_9ORYZ
MPSFPPPGAVTICEMNRDLVAADALSDDRSKEAYGDVLGMVFSSIPFQPDALVANQEPPAVNEAEPAETVPKTSFVSTIADSFNQLLFPSCDPNLLGEFDTQKVSWNQHRHCLAFVSGKDQVTVHDFEELDNKESYILTSDHQKDVKAVEWRPNSGKMIAVGCKGGICLWSASYPGNAASIKSGVTSSSFGAFPRVSGGQWILVDILRGSSSELVWEHLYDVDLRWNFSLMGNKYMDIRNMGANWDPEGRVALLSFSNSTTLGSIHFSSKPPSLDCHLLPVELPEISSLIVSGFIRGPGEGAKPLAFAFHNKFKQGPLLSVV